MESFDTIYYLIFIACGNKVTAGTRIADGNKVAENEWPTLALAISENSTVRCTSTIGELRAFYLISLMIIVMNLNKPKLYCYICSCSAMGARQLFMHHRQNGICERTQRRNYMDVVCWQQQLR